MATDVLLAFFADSEYNPNFTFEPASPGDREEPITSVVQAAIRSADVANAQHEQESTLEPLRLDDLQARSISPAPASLHDTPEPAYIPDLPLSQEPMDPNGVDTMFQLTSQPPLLSYPPMPEPLPTIGTPTRRHHPYGSAATPSDTFAQPSDSHIGPLRTRRTQQAKQLSLDARSLDVLSGYKEANYAEGDQRGTSEGGELPKNEEGERLISMGGHSIAIPLKSPIVAPQLQAHVRLTSTGKPSHARKVPDDHVKRPRNAFILFRSYACTSNLLPQTLGITDHRQVSRVVGQLWKGLKPEEKAIWEKKAAEEKEEHKLRNPNYRYRPVYRRETTTKRKRRKPTDDDEAEEEERKCEVVARVLLEGREVSEDQLQQEVEEQRIKDQEEGRHRSRSRSRSRSKSVNGGHGDMRHGRPSSAPPGQDPFQLDYMDQQMDDGFLRPGMLQSRSAATRSRAKTMPTQNDFDFSNTPFYGTSINPLMPATGPDYGFSMSGRLGSIGGLPVPSPRTAANMQSLFNAVNGDDSNGFAYPSGLKGNDENISLLSPSYSRKFSLGRWEIPQTASGPSIFASPAASHQPLNYSQYPDTATVNPGQPNYTYGANTGYNQPFTQGGDQAQPAPTYVYLSKADAENPEIVNHYLAQGYGVSYDA